MYFNRDQITKERYKMYKNGKKWVTVSLVVVGVVVGLNAGQPATGSAATGSVPQEETPGDMSVESPLEQTLNAPEPVASTEDPAAESPTTEIATADPKLEDTYDNAQQQVNEANGQSQAVNDSQAKLQALLDQSDLTSQEDWQATLQAALDDYQKNASGFDEAATKAQALIATYQDKITDTTKEQDNAVKTVTNPDGKTLGDYQNAVNDFKASVDEQVATVQTNLANYTVSVQVNQSSIDLTTAADELNAGLQQPTLSSEALMELKATYDQAIAGYNEAVITYNTQMETALATIQSEDLPDLTQLLADRQVQVAYNSALEKFQAVQQDIEAYQEAITVWQTAVEAYNTALETLRETGDLTADDTELLAAQSVVEAAVKRITTTQAAYTDFMAQPENQAIISAYLDVEKNYADEFLAYETAQSEYTFWQAKLEVAQKQLRDAQEAGRPTIAAEEAIANAEDKLQVTAEDVKSTQEIVETIAAPINADYAAFLQKKQAVSQPVDQALAEFQTALTSWQEAYKTYHDAITGAVQKLPDFESLDATVQEAQSEMTTAFATLTNSQADYQKALTAYQSALTESGRTTNAMTGELPDLAELQNGLNNEMTQNEKVMTAMPDYLTMRQAEAQLQQRVGQLNQIIAAINADQEMLKTLYATAEQGNVWTVLTPYFQAVGDDLIEKSVDYQLAISGGDRALSYDTLVDNLKNAQADYDAEADPATYPEVTAQYQKFEADFTTFKAAYQEFLKELAKSEPNPAANAVAAGSMKNGANLSTDGVPTDITYFDEGTTTINIYRYVGSDLTYFVGRGVGNSESNLREDRYGNVPFVLIGETDKTETTSASGTPYKIVSPEALAKLASTLEGVVQPFVVKNGITYHLAGVHVSGAGNDEISRSQSIQTRDEIYTFTSLDPIGEFMAMFSGVSVNVNANHNFDFLYTALPQENTKLFSEETLPSLNLLEGAEFVGGEPVKLTADSEVPQALAPNEADNMVTGEYPGGETVAMDFTVTLTSTLAPTITLNHIRETPTEPTGNNPGLPDSENPETDEQIPQIGAGDDGVTSPNKVKTTLQTPKPGQPTSQHGKTSHPTTLTTGEDETADQLNASVIVSDGIETAAALVKTKGDRPSKVTTSQAVLPQTNEQSHGFLALIGSLLLALSGLSIFKESRRKR